jgi:hypothetical protein
VKLQDIQLVNLRCSRVRKLPPEGQAVLLDIYVSAQHQLVDGALVAEIKFRTKTVPPSLQADATFYLRYALASAVSDRDAASFTKHNAVFNAWPYWRELVQSCALRMGLAPLTMPLLRA